MAGVTFKYLGHSTFLFTTPAGKKVIIDPWIMKNPACPAAEKNITEVDTILVTHGHFDHIQDAVELGKRLKPAVGCIYETSLWLKKKGVENLSFMNKGGTQKINDLKVTMTDAHHSCGILDDDGSVIYGGEAAGYVVEFENGFRIYHSGDTCVFGDMKIIAELYKPDLIFLPIGDLYTMNPKEAAYACRLMNAKRVVPMHYATFPPLIGRPEELRELTKDIGTEVLALKPGETGSQ